LAGVGEGKGRKNKGFHAATDTMPRWRKFRGGRRSGAQKGRKKLSLRREIGVEGEVGLRQAWRGSVLFTLGQRCPF